MEEYISKSALVAEIKRLDEFYHLSKGAAGQAFIEGLLSFLNALKVEEVDLDSEITLWANAIPEIRLDDVERLAKYFFELGLKIGGEKKQPSYNYCRG